MAQWPLIPRERTPQGGRHPAGHTRLPLFYMNDYSRLGLRVDSCEAARQVLAENRLGVTQDDDGWHVDLEGPSQVEAVVSLLNSRGVACDITDVVDQVYRG